MRFIIKKLQSWNVPISLKLGLAFALVLLCLIGNGLSIVFLLNNIQHNVEQSKIIHSSIQELQRYEAAYRGQIVVYSDSLLVNKSLVGRGNSRAIILETLTQNLSSKEENTPDYRFKTTFARLYLTVVEKLNQMDRILARDNFDSAREFWTTFITDIDSITKLFEKRSLELNEQRLQSEQQLNSSLEFAYIVSLGLILFSLGLVLFLLYLIRQVVVQPINLLQRALHQVSEGDLEQKLEVANRDEVGKLAQSFTRAVTSLRQVLLGVRISANLQKVTSELSVVSQQQAKGSSEQVAALTQVMSAMEELGRSADMIAESAVAVADITGVTKEQIDRVADVTVNSQQNAFQMIEVVEHTLNGVERVGRQVEEFNRLMGVVNQQAETINKIATLHSSIADEIHLVALNAAIEAVSAGVYGQRFKAVAREIKQLASRAAQTNQEVVSLITGVQTSTRSALEQIQEGQAEVAAVVEFNSQLRQNLEKLEQSSHLVTEAVGELQELASLVTNQAEEIKQATFQQRVSSEQVIHSARSAGDVAGEAAQASKQVTMSSVELELLSNQLNSVLNQVKLAS